MYSHPQKRGDESTKDLRLAAGKWLKEMREKAGLSQRQLAALIGAEYYTFVSQLENGRGRIPPDSYRVWADALGVPVRDFVKQCMSFYDPLTFEILFPDEARTDQATLAADVERVGSRG